MHLGGQIGTLGLQSPGPEAREPLREFCIARLRDDRLDHGGLLLASSARLPSAHAGDQLGEVALRRVAIGYAIAVAIGVPLGLWMGLSPTVFAAGVFFVVLTTICLRFYY